MHKKAVKGLGVFIHTQTCRFTESGVDFSLVNFLVNYNRLSYEKRINYLVKVNILL